MEAAECMQLILVDQDNEMPQSIICDPQGNLIVAGRSNSPNYPVKPANNLQGTGGGFDIIVTKLNAAGKRTRGLYEDWRKGSDGANIDDYPSGATFITSQLW